MVANVDAERAEEIEPRHGPSQARPAEQPRYANQHGQTMHDKNKSENGHIGTNGASRVKIPQSPHASIHDAGFARHLISAFWDGKSTGSRFHTNRPDSLWVCSLSTKKSNSWTRLGQSAWPGNSDWFWFARNT